MVRRAQWKRGVLRDADDPRDLHLAAGVDHLFNGKGHEEEMLEEAVDWFEQWVENGD